MISIFIFTFYIINQVSIFDFHITRLVLQIFLINSEITEVLELPKCQLPTLNVMAIYAYNVVNICVCPCMC